MNVLSKSIIGLLGVTSIAGAIFGYKEYQHNRQWEQQQYHNAIFWVQMQSMHLRAFDYSLAEALAANSPAKRQEAIDGAIEDAGLIMHELSSASATMNLQALYWPAYESFSVDSSRYLAYPLSEKGPTLNSDQLEQIRRMRKFARAAMPYVDRMKANGVSLADIQQISAEMDAALAKLDGISIYGNKAFNEFRYHLYIPVREQVPIPQMKVVWRFDPRTGELTNFDASGYFRDYNKNFPLHPKLTAKQAAAALSPNLRAAGSPMLEIHEGKLVYEIPVTGVEGVRFTYVNALKGSIESIAYTP